MKGACLRQPTHKQFKFVQVYLETLDVEQAYIQANYTDVSHCKERWRRRAYWRVMQGKAVGELLRLAMFEWASTNGVTASKIADALVHIINTADTIKDQVAAFRELTQIAGYRKSPSLRKKKTRAVRKQKQDKIAA